SASWRLPVTMQSERYRRGCSVRKNSSKLGTMAGSCSGTSGTERSSGCIVADQSRRSQPRRQQPRNFSAAGKRGGLSRAAGSAGRRLDELGRLGLEGRPAPRGAEVVGPALVRSDVASRGHVHGHAAHGVDLLVALLGAVGLGGLVPVVAVLGVFAGNPDRDLAGGLLLDDPGEGRPA